MHFIFVPYGIKHAVDKLLQEMECQKFQLKLSREGEPDKMMWIQGSVRLLPFGVVEYVFPREYRDAVLTTLNIQTEQYPQYKNAKFRVALAFLRKFLHADPVPKFKTDESLIWIKDFVSVLPIGIREDGDMIEVKGDFLGWKHEKL